jgi:hypothetical protein
MPRPRPSNAQRRPSVPSDSRQPTEVFDAYWIFAERRDSKSYPASTERRGKWLLFIKTAEIDEWWSRIKAATENDLLGCSAKVATMRENPNAVSRDTKVICVYTYDVEDDADRTRIRQALRDLGVTWKIPYKTDEATYAGKYSFNSKRVSTHFE